jgi:hypothetical protein
VATDADGHFSLDTLLCESRYSERETKSRNRKADA